MRGCFSGASLTVSRLSRNLNASGAGRVTLPHGGTPTFDSTCGSSLACSVGMSQVMSGLGRTYHLTRTPAKSFPRRPGVKRRPRVLGGTRGLWEDSRVRGRFFNTAAAVSLAFTQWAKYKNVSHIPSYLTRLFSRYCRHFTNINPLKHCPKNLKVSKKAIEWP